jgi:phosphoribosyl-AMP cyclohydrolase
MMKFSNEMAEKFALQLKYDNQGLLPAIVQDSEKNVLMLAYMDKEAVQRTLTCGQMWYYSRSRKAYWLKGETSGHYQEVLAVHRDCDNDTLLFTVQQTGWACHEDFYTCFHYQLQQDGKEAVIGEHFGEEK